MATLFIEQPRRGKTHEVQLTPYKAVGRSMGMGTSNKTASHRTGLSTIIVLVLAVLATACSKPEKKELAGTWRWTSTSGGFAGEYFTPESEGFEAELVFKGSRFTLYKDGEKISSGTYHIQSIMNGGLHIDKEEPFYYGFDIYFRLSEAQCQKISEATNGKIKLCAYNFLATIMNSEEEGEVFSICDNMNDGFCYTFVKKK